MTFDFGSLNNNKKKTSTTKRTSSSKTPSKSSSRSSSSRSSSSRSTRRRRSSNPLSGLFKGKNKNLYTYGSLIGGFVILLLIVVFCFSGESSSTHSPQMDKRAYLERANEYTNNHEYQKAIDAYKKAYEIDPHDSYATDQISILYRNNLHDESSAEYWKSKSEQITANKVDSSRGESAKAYAEKAARKAQRKSGGRR